jgi:murein DD-endopeptidase MepM/ murein hydrolase activator NlpD
MQIMITHDGMARTRNWSLSRPQLALGLGALVVVLLMLSGAIYHFIFLKAAQEGWPVVSQLVKLVVRDEFAQRDRFMRENLDAMATKVGDLQAKMIRMDAQAERLGRLAGVKPEDLKALQAPATAASASTGSVAAASAPASAAATMLGGKGGPFVPLDHPTLAQLNDALSDLDQQVDLRSDVFTLAESRLFESRLTALMIPNSRPIDGPVGSGYGFRSDPFTGRAALHTGLDFPADVGRPIRAAAGGVVVSTDVHPEYGNLLVIDHGNGLVTRYAHTSKILVKTGDLVRRDQVVALVGTSGRSTGPHLHFEVLVDGVTQNPARFLAAGPAPSLASASAPALAH